MAGKIVRALAQTGRRIFDRQDIGTMMEPMGLQPSYLSRMLNLLETNGELISLGKGLYSLPPELLAGGPLHSFEIALKLAKKGAISHRSALAYYELTDQIISKVYVTVPREPGANLSTRQAYILQGTEYYLIRIAPQNYWGIKMVFIGEASFWVTDLERTLLDGLSRPELCGGFREVIFALEKATPLISTALILEYAQRTSLVVCKRLGWVLEKLDLYPEIQEELATLPMTYVQKLDPLGVRKGKINKRWNLWENL